MTVNESQLIDLLRQRYSPPEWAFLTQVRNATGFSGQVRTADAIAMGCYPSRGLHLHGFEIKCSRKDWLGELNDPTKAEEIARRCDFWWVVAPKGLVRDGELPANWGLIQLHGESTLRCAVEATQIEQPDPIERAFLAAILRRAQQEMPAEAQISEAERRGYERGVEYGKEQGQRAGRAAERELESIKDLVASFEEHTGIDLQGDSYQEDLGFLPSRDEVASVVRLILAGARAVDEVGRIVNRITRMNNVAESAQQEMSDAVDRLRRMQEELEHG